MRPGERCRRADRRHAEGHAYPRVQCDPAGAMAARPRCCCCCCPVQNPCSVELVDDGAARASRASAAAAAGGSQRQYEACLTVGCRPHAGSSAALRAPSRPRRLPRVQASTTASARHPPSWRGGRGRRRPRRGSRPSTGRTATSGSACARSRGALCSAASRGAPAGRSRCSGTRRRSRICGGCTAPLDLDSSWSSGGLRGPEELSLHYCRTPQANEILPNGRTPHARLGRGFMIMLGLLTEFRSIEQSLHSHARCGTSAARPGAA